MRVYLLIMLVAAGVTFLSVPLVRQFALVTGTVAPVRERDVHTHPTPRLGGVAMALGFIAAMLIARHTDYLGEAVGSAAGWGVMLGAALICLLGVIDDIWDLDWLTKLLGQILIAGLVAWMGVQLVSFPIFGLTIGSSRLSLVVTALVVVVAINAVNFVDGLDGLAAGMIGIGAIGLFIYSYSLARTLGEGSFASLATAVVAALAGICLGFLPHNFSPASIFMGDSGAMLLGLLTASGAIIVAGQIDPANVYFRQAFPSFLPILLPLAVLALPLFDMTFAVVRRLAAGKSPFHPDRKHLHHRLLDAGRSRQRAVLIMYLWTAVFSLGAASMVLFRIRTVLGISVFAALVAAVITVEALPGLKHWLGQKLRRGYIPPRGPAHSRRLSRASQDPAPAAEPAPSLAAPAASGSAPAVDTDTDLDSREEVDTP